MNRTFRLVWNDKAKTVTVTHGWVDARGKRLSVRAAALAAAAFPSLWGGPALAAGPAPTALPTGAQVAAGQAAITTAGATMNVSQTSAKAVLNWQSFDIGANAAVIFNQPNASAVALNRVVGQDPSAIYGRLSANGQVFLVNPNGVLFAPGAQVNVGGLVASALDIGDQNFLAGTYRFDRNGATGSVINQGSLTAGYAALLGAQVRNQGVITAPMGTVALAAGEAVTLGVTGQDLISVQVDKASIDTLVENHGLIQVDGGTALLSAQSANALLGQVVNTGQIAANGIESDGGVIRLTASSLIDHSGVLSADAGANGKGGSVSVIAALDNPQSLTRVSGAISARGGAQSGDGGSVETSANRLKIADGARVDTTAAKGSTGSWLLDPYDFTIAASNGDITGAALSAALGSSDVTIATSDTSVSCTAATCGAGSSTGNGDIHVNDAVSWGSAHTLTLSAWNNININAPITVSGTGGLALQVAQSDIAANFPSGLYYVNAPVSLAAGAHFSTKVGSDGPTTPYTVITSAAGLQAVASDLAGNYVLGGDVNISGIASWTPLGTLATPFIGYFDGLGHKVIGLTHPNAGADTEVGLFGAAAASPLQAAAYGQIQNVGLTGVNVAGSQNVGALIGFNNTFVANSYAIGVVTGSGANASSPVGGIGGLIGYSQGPIFGSYANVTVSATSGDQSSGTPVGTFVNPHGTGGIGGLTGVALTAVNWSYALGAVTGNNAVGGLVGYSGAAIDTTYSVGLVTGATVNARSATNVGGLIGQVDPPFNSTPFIFNSFWDVTTSSQTTSANNSADAANVVGLTTAQMKTASNFTGNWITSGAWELRNGQYPLLKQMLQPIFVIANNRTTTYNAAAVTGFTSTIGPAGLGANYSGSVAVTPSTLNPTNAGSYTLTASGLSLTNPGDQQGYRLQYVPGVLTINAAPLLTTITGSLTGAFRRTYDGTTAANGLTAGNFVLTGWLGGDGATVTKTTGLFDNANAGTGKTITVTLASGDYHATGSTNLSNYILPTSVQGAIGRIDPAVLNLTVAKTYNASASFNSGFTFSGVVAGEAAPTVTSGSATVSSAYAGAYNGFVASDLALSNPNYTLAGGTVSATIDRAPLNVTVSKIYDGNASFSGGFTFSGMAPGDAAPTLIGGTAVVSSADATTYGSFLANSLLLSNPNYTLRGGLISASITPKALDVLSLSDLVTPTGALNSALNVGQTISGSLTSVLTPGTNGILATDGSLTLTGSGAWAVTGGGTIQAGAPGSLYPVTASGVTFKLTGAGASNYTLTGTSVSAKIRASAAPPSVSSNPAVRAVVQTVAAQVASSQASTIISTAATGGFTAGTGGFTAGGIGGFSLSSDSSPGGFGSGSSSSSSSASSGSGSGSNSSGSGGSGSTSSVSNELVSSNIAVFTDDTINRILALSTGSPSVVVATNTTVNIGLGSGNNTVVNSPGMDLTTLFAPASSRAPASGNVTIPGGTAANLNTPLAPASGLAPAASGNSTVIGGTTANLITSLDPGPGSRAGSGITTGTSAGQIPASSAAPSSGSGAGGSTPLAAPGGSTPPSNQVGVSNNGVVVVQSNDTSQPIQFRDNPPDNVLVTMPSQRPVDIQAGAGSNTVIGGGPSTIVQAGSGGSTVVSGTTANLNTLFAPASGLAPGNVLSNAPSQLTPTLTDRSVIGGGASTITTGGANNTVFQGGGGNATVINGATANLNTPFAAARAGASSAGAAPTTNPVVSPGGSSAAPATPSVPAAPSVPATPGASISSSVSTSPATPSTSVPATQPSTSQTVQAPPIQRRGVTPSTKPVRD